MKKTTLVALTALTMASVFADDMSKKDNGQMMQSSGGNMMAQTAYDNMGPKLASARPNIDGYGWYMFGEFLWWHTQQDGTDWAYRAETHNATELSYDNHRVDFGWSPGFRVGLGWNMDYDEWDTNVHYTWFQASRKSNLGTKDSTSFPLMAPGFQTTDANNHWTIHYSMFDWELGRNYFVSPKLSLRPYGGIKGGWINQNVKEEFNLSPTAGIAAGTEMHAHRENNMWVVGPSAGMNTKWFFAAHKNHDFSFFGDMAGALLWGHFSGENTVRFNNAVTIPLGASSFTSWNVHDLNMNRAIATLRGVVGWAWDTNFNKDRCHFCLSVAWEAQYWFNANQMLNSNNNPIDFGTNAVQRFNYSRTSNDLMFQGGVLGMRFDF